MFTGLIQDRGAVVRAQRSGKMLLLGVRSSLPVHSFEIGESISINGVCQTVVRTENDVFFVEVSPETLERTTLGKFNIGREVNLERALLATDRLGGHFVQGHVDGRGVVRRVDKSSAFIVVSVQVSAELAPYLVEKGSVAVDGVSLTVNAVDEQGFSVGLIPHTAQSTCLVNLEPGDDVNVETDLIAKYIERFLALRQGGEPGKITMTSLAEAGFLK
ncbi:MAG: riboflavin synthase [Candidatus Alcyoniella australis]|nr:riboflavin synthase [Candidatus Alcyoniella australis]